MSTVAMSGDMRDPKPGHTWRSKDGTINGTMQFGDESWPYVAFYSSAEARAHAAAAIAIAEAACRSATASRKAPSTWTAAPDGGTMTGRARSGLRMARHCASVLLRA